MGIVLRQRRRSLVYQPTSDEDFLLAAFGVVAGLAAVFLPIVFYRLRHRPAKGDVHDYVREAKRRSVAQTKGKSEPDEDALDYAVAMMKRYRV